MGAVAGTQDRVRVPYDPRVPMCPACGHNRPLRALCICRECWSYLPQELRMAAINAKKDSPKDVHVGQMAAKVISTAVERKALVTEERKR